MPNTSATQEGSPHKTIRKKTSLASKIRMVFIKPMSNSSGSSASNSNSNGSSNGGGSFSTSKEHDVDVNNNHYHNYHHQTLEDIVSMSSRDGDYDAQGGLLRSSSVGGGSAGELCPPGSHLIEHRGSVSSSSSGESMSVGQGGFSTSSPSTSPEMSPSGSPKPKHALASLIIGPSTAIAGGSIPNRHPLSPVEINHSSNDLTAPLATSCGPKPFEKRMSMEPTSTRTSKKRLSFASITSFFNPRNADAMAASKKKQQRSSSVPNVESPLIVVAGGVAGVAGRPGSSSFQRRHSLNDLETGPQMQAKFAAPPWDKDRVSAQAAAAAAEVMANNASENETSSAAGATTMSKIQGVFGKQSKKNKSKKNKNKKNASHSIDNVPTTATVSTAKPLRSALTHRAVRAPSVRKVQVVHRHQGSVSSTGRRLHQSEPLVNLSQETGVHDSNGGDGSRRSSEEHGRTGPTRHRRQSSITGRQASQHGHYTAVDRKQRVSVRYSSSEEYDIAQHFDLYTPDQHQQQQQQQQQQFQYHGGCIQYDNPAVPQTPRGNPVSTKSMSPQANDPFNHALANISPSTSRGACAEGSFAFSPVGSRRRDSYISCSSGSPSKDTSPKLTFVSTPKQQTHAAVAAAVSNHHRRSSYETNSRRSSMIVTPASPSSVAPVARLSIDHTLMPDHPGPASPSAYPQSTIAAMSPHGHHAIFANHQQQLHYQQQQQQQQFQRHHQMQFLPEQHHHHLHQHQYNHNQQFMTSHAGSQVFHDQYHISSPPQQHQQQQHYQQQQQYQPYPYQYNMQQPMPSHLCYPSVQHPALSYTGVNMSLPPPPPALRYSSSGSGGKRGSNGPSPSTPLRPTRQLHFSTAQHQVHVTWTPDQYDRTSDPNITAHRLTPAIAQKIKLELNTFKSQEMLVHQESRVNTHFFA
ncbi:hypothetical protein BGW39_004546 [Mortierella sp. 14UC]|nr:hypothetical protein BGW39_004546 [Mortierella sp. 14UC]